MANGTRNKILRYALINFAQRGFKGVTVREIAASAGVTMTLIYHYFPDKEALYEAAAHDAFTYVTERMVGAVKHGHSGKARLRSFLNEFLEILCSDAPEVRLVDRELMEGRPERLAELGAEIVKLPLRALMDIILEISPLMPAAEIAEHIIATAHGSAKLRLLRVHVLGAERLLHARGIAESLYEFYVMALTPKTLVTQLHAPPDVPRG